MSRQQSGPSGFTTSTAFNVRPEDQPARQVDRQAIPEQIRLLNAAIKKNIDRVAGLQRAGDYYKAAQVIQRFLSPQIGTIQALTDRLNTLTPGHVAEPLLSTHVAPRIKVARKSFKRWSDK